MSPSISIRPSKDIRTNYAQISALTRQNPVAITVNGKEDTVLLSHEDFRDQLHYISELEAKNELFSEFKAVKDGNVWYTGKNLYQATDTVGELIKDMHLMLTDGDASQMTFLEKME